ncbi:MAG: hypothetical protein O2913_09090 [Chloroflexi bacterium]|nr:hypothetical protein [Chloroflexota bacterium]
MEKDVSIVQNVGGKFQPLQLVKIKSNAETAMKDPGLPVPIKPQRERPGWWRWRAISMCGIPKVRLL